MASKEKDPHSEEDSAKPDSVPEEATRSTEEPEVVLPEDPFPPTTLASSLKAEKEKKPSSLWGILFFFFLVIAGGIGAGGYYLYQEQMKFQNETFAKLSHLEAQLSTLDTEADQARQNKQSIDSLSQGLQQFRTEMGTVLKSHQNFLTTLDEDVMRLKEKATLPAEVLPVPPSIIGKADTNIIDKADTEADPVPGGLSPESQDEKALEDTVAEEDDTSYESQKFVKWMENFLSAIWNWLVGLFR